MRLSRVRNSGRLSNVRRSTRTTRTTRESYKEESDDSSATLSSSSNVSSSPEYSSSSDEDKLWIRGAEPDSMPLPPGILGGSSDEASAHVSLTDTAYDDLWKKVAEPGPPLPLRRQKVGLMASGSEKKKTTTENNVPVADEDVFESTPNKNKPPRKDFGDMTPIPRVGNIPISRRTIVAAKLKPKARKKRSSKNLLFDSSSDEMSTEERPPDPTPAVGLPAPDTQSYRSTVGSTSSSIAFGVIGRRQSKQSLSSAGTNASHIYNPILKDTQGDDKSGKGDERALGTDSNPKTDHRRTSGENPSANNLVNVSKGPVKSFTSQQPISLEPEIPSSQANLNIEHPISTSPSKSSQPSTSNALGRKSPHHSENQLAEIGGGSSRGVTSGDRIFLVPPPISSPDSNAYERMSSTEPEISQSRNIPSRRGGKKSTEIEVITRKSISVIPEESSSDKESVVSDVVETATNTRSSVRLSETRPKSVPAIAKDLFDILSRTINHGNREESGEEASSLPQGMLPVAVARGSVSMDSRHSLPHRSTTRSEPEISLSRNTPTRNSGISSYETSVRRSGRVVPEKTSPQRSQSQGSIASSTMNPRRSGRFSASNLPEPLPAITPAIPILATPKKHTRNLRSQKFETSQVEDMFSSDEEVNSSGTVKPSNSASGSKPSNSASGSKPSNSASGSKPSDSVAGSQPSNSVAGSKQSDSVAGSKPSDSVVGSKLSLQTAVSITALSGARSNNVSMQNRKTQPTNNERPWTSSFTSRSVNLDNSSSTEEQFSPRGRVPSNLNSRSSSRISNLPSHSKQPQIRNPPTERGNNSPKALDITKSRRLVPIESSSSEDEVFEHKTIHSNTAKPRLSTHVSNSNLPKPLSRNSNIQRKETDTQLDKSSLTGSKRKKTQRLASDDNEEGSPPTRRLRSSTRVTVTHPNQPLNTNVSSITRPSSTHTREPERENESSERAGSKHDRPKSGIKLPRQKSRQQSLPPRTLTTEVESMDEDNSEEEREETSAMNRASLKSQQGLREAEKSRPSSTHTREPERDESSERAGPKPNRPKSRIKLPRQKSRQQSLPPRTVTTEVESMDEDDSEEEREETSAMNRTSLKSQQGLREAEKSRPSSTHTRESERDNESSQRAGPKPNRPKARIKLPRQKTGQQSLPPRTVTTEVENMDEDDGEEEREETSGTNRALLKSRKRSSEVEKKLKSRQPTKSSPPTKQIRKQRKTPEERLKELCGNKNLIKLQHLRNYFIFSNQKISTAELHDMHRAFNDYAEKFFDRLCKNAARPYGMFTFRQLEEALKAEGLISNEPMELLKVFMTSLTSQQYRSLKGIIIPADGETDTLDF